jgi:predicted lipid-binding transport protein (Tim44 family)
LAVIVILALVALFIGLRLYSVLGERTGHEQQQPILKPADPDARVEPRPAQPSVVTPTAQEAGDMAFLPTAGPGVRALLAADPSFDVARFLEGAKAAYRVILEAFWKGDLGAVRQHVDQHVFDTVRFEADIAAVTRNAEGDVVAGSLSDAVQTRDLWTFRRDVGSRDPNWLLIETDEEE